MKHVDFIQFDSSRAGYHLVLGFRLSVRYKKKLAGTCKKKYRILAGPN